MEGTLEGGESTPLGPHPLLVGMDVGPSWWGRVWRVLES